MSQTADRNDEVLAIFQEKTPAAPPLVADESFAAQAPAEVGAPVRALTVLAILYAQINGQSIARLSENR